MLNMDLIGRTYYSNKVTALLTLLHVVLWITTLFFYRNPHAKFKINRTILKMDLTKAMF